MRNSILQLVTIISLAAILSSCYTSQQNRTGENTGNNQEKFWQSLQQLCGKAYKGTVIAAPANDTVFKDKILVMHVRACEKGRIRIPFFVGENRSRTWVFTKTKVQLLLKHDHRHKDGVPDSITMYGGKTTNSGMANLQLFPADQETTNMLPAAATNVWWVELVPGKYFTYNLRRMGTDRLFSIRFDLSSAIDIPEAPWGWKD
jgi:hypothetical protein